MNMPVQYIYHRQNGFYASHPVYTSKQSLTTVAKNSDDDDDDEELKLKISLALLKSQALFSVQHAEFPENWAGLGIPDSRLQLVVP